MGCVKLYDPKNALVAADMHHLVYNICLLWVEISEVNSEISLL